MIRNLLQKLFQKRIDELMELHWDVLMEIWDIGQYEVGRKSFYYARLNLHADIIMLKMNILKALAGMQ